LLLQFAEFILFQPAPLWLSSENVVNGCNCEERNLSDAFHAKDRRGSSTYVKVGWTVFATKKLQKKALTRGLIAKPKRGASHGGMIWARQEERLVPEAASRQLHRAVTVNQW